MNSVQHSSFTGTPDYLQLSVTLAMEIVSGLSKPSEVFARHGYTPAQAQQMVSNPAFQRMLKEARSTWDADSNAEERIRIKARLALEELIPAHYVLASSPDTPPAARNEAVKTFERLSGMAAQKEPGTATGERFVVNINLGESKAAITIDAPALQAEEN